MIRITLPAELLQMSLQATIEVLKKCKEKKDKIIDKLEKKIKRLEKQLKDKE